MDPRTRTRVEVETLHTLLPELDYYRVLLVARDCAPEAIGEAFRNESRRLHPDRVSVLGDAALSEKANDIFRLVQEAHRTLKDPEQRARYDELLAGGSIRFTDEARQGAQADKRAADPEHAATNKSAEKYWKMALRDFRDKSWKAAVINIRFALTFEPDNDTFKEYLKQAEEAQAEADSKKEKNPYKLRIV
jgi:curved DNA-binding protein CbpA